MFVLITPAILGVLLYRLRNKVEEQGVVEKFGSLFYEFKMDKGFISQLFYLVFILRRLQFIITQTILYDYVYIQYSLNLIFSLLQFMYVVYFRPFKEFHVMVSELIGEFCVILTILLSGFWLPYIEKGDYPGLEQTYIYNILGCIFAQSALGMFSFYFMIKELIKSYRIYKLKKEFKSAQKVFSDNSVATIAGLSCTNTIQPALMDVDEAK